jgi:hypothetical protein
MRRDSLDELTCAGEPHWRNLTRRTGPGVVPSGGDPRGGPLDPRTRSGRSRIGSNSAEANIGLEHEGLIRGHGGEIHRQQHARLGQFADTDDRPSRTMVAHLLDVGCVHRVEVAHLAQEDVDVDDVR